MGVEQVIRQLNWVDWGLLLIVLVSVVMGIRRGFLLGAVDLAGMVVSLVVAALGYRPTAALLVQAGEVPPAIAGLAAFGGLVLLTQIVYSAVVNLLSQVGRPLWARTAKLAVVDRGFGVVPGAIQGLIFASIVLLPFALFPLAPPVSASIDRSALASRLIQAVVAATPQLQAQVGGELGSGFSLITPQQTARGLQLNLSSLGQLAPDPVAEEQMLELVNHERARAGLSPLQLDEQLRAIARSYSLELFRSGELAHESQETGSVVDRLKRANLRYTAAGENLAYAPNVQVAHDGLMKSPGHRANILRPEFARIGIGVIRSELRGSILTQAFTD